MNTTITAGVSMKSIDMLTGVGVLLAVLSAAGCRNQDERPLGLSRMALERVAKDAPAPAMHAMPPQRETTESERQLSYSHQLEISLPPTELRSAYQRLLDACASSPENGCLVMNSTVSGTEWPQASVLMKIRRVAVAPLLTKAEGLGQVTSERTTAEDLGGPLVDTERRLAMKKSLRDSLMELRGRSRSELEPLLKVTEKLAEVQAEIEADEGQQAGLRARLEIDNFEVELRSVGMPDRPNEVISAVQDFGRDLSRGIASVIGFVAYALPWVALLLGMPFLWRFARKVWRWRRKPQPLRM